MSTLTSPDATAQHHTDAPLVTATRRSGRTTRSIGTRLRAELLGFTREPGTVFFGFAFPIVLFAIFASIFTDEYQTPDGASFTGASVYLAGMIAVALMSAGFLENVATVTTERESGTLQRLYCSPMPRSAYLGGRIAMVVVNAAAQVAVLMIVATIFFDVQAPSDWLTFAWVVALGTAATASMGLAVSGLITSARAATAIANGFTNVLAFLSGCYIPTHDLPDWMIRIGQAFPAYWIAHALRSVLLPDQYATIEPAGEWQLGVAALVLGAWVIVGLLVASRTFRWAPSQPNQRRR